MLFGKEFLFFQPPKIKFLQKQSKTQSVFGAQKILKDFLVNEKFGIYLFGIAYAIGSLGCVFPIFLSIVIQGIASKSILDGTYTILAYVLGMSIVMVSITTLTFATKYLILKKLDSILPYIKKLSAVVLVFAGIYMIYYQYLLII